LKKAYSILVSAGRHWMADDASTTAAALAFYCAFSLAPLLVILLTIAGWIVGNDDAYIQVGAQLTGLFGPATAKALLSAMKNSQHPHGVAATAISAVTLLIAATTVLAALEEALEKIWQSASSATAGIRGWLRARFLSLGFILTLGFLLLISLTISTALASLQAQLAERHETLVGAIEALDILLSLLLVSALFLLIFRFMPALRLPWRVVAAGGFLTGVLFEGGRWGIGVYLAHSTQASAFGAAASFAALLLWFYYTALILLFGAEFTAVLGGLRNSAVNLPRAHAPDTPSKDRLLGSLSR
jgi:membrane protein